MMIPDLNRLKVFYLIYVHRSVSVAAKELHITQSAVSQHLKKLEVELDTLLFTRIHKRLLPTSQGDALYAVMAPFMESLEEEIQHIHRARQEPYGLGQSDVFLNKIKKKLAKEETSSACTF